MSSSWPVEKNKIQPLLGERGLRPSCVIVIAGNVGHCLVLAMMNMHMSWARIRLLFHFSALHFTSCVTCAVTYSHAAPHTPNLRSPLHSLALTIRPFGQAMEHSSVANICTCYGSRVTLTGHKSCGVNAMKHKPFAFF